MGRRECVEAEGRVAAHAAASWDSPVTMYQFRASRESRAPMSPACTKWHNCRNCEWEPIPRPPIDGKSYYNRMLPSRKVTDLGRRKLRFLHLHSTLRSTSASLRLRAVADQLDVAGTQRHAHAPRRKRPSSGTDDPKRHAGGKSLSPPTLQIPGSGPTSGWGVLRRAVP